MRATSHSPVMKAIFGVAALNLAACATEPREPLVQLSACPVVPGELWTAGELPDGLPTDPADAVLTLYRAWVEARAALVRAQRILADE